MNAEFTAYAKSRGLKYRTGLTVDDEGEMYEQHFVYRFDGNRYAALEITEALVENTTAWPTLVDLAADAIKRELNAVLPLG